MTGNCIHVDFFRLEAYERNNNFGQPEDLLSEFSMNVPVAASFKDVNTDMKMAPIDVEKANKYMYRFAVGFDDKGLICIMIFFATS